LPLYAYFVQEVSTLSLGDLIPSPYGIVLGTAASDILKGIEKDETLVGFAGNDSIDGGLGDDRMYGGLGNDSFFVNSPGDVVVEYPGLDIDTINSSITYNLGENLENLTLTANDAINGTGNSLSNIITGNEAENVLNGSDGNDTLYGRGGNDILLGGQGDDSMLGGVGDDTYELDNIFDTITELTNEGNADTVNSSISYTLGDNLENLKLTGNVAINGSGNSLNNTITGNNSNNFINGQAGNDILSGEGGNDSIDGGLDDDLMSGGLGDETYYVDSINDKITEFNNEGSDNVFASVSYTLSANLENLTLTGNNAIKGTGNNINNIITGNNNDNFLYGLDGNDTLIGGDGTDYIDGGLDADSMLGGLGSDSYFVENISDIITEFINQGIDIVYSSVAYTLSDNLENLTLTGNSPINGIGNIINNIINGNDANNALDGKAGNDTLFGNNDNDNIFGDIGDDKLIGGTGADILNGGDNSDTASYFNATSEIFANLSTGQGADGDASGDIYQFIENLEGSEFSDRLFGDNQNNSLSGLGGDDILNGFAGKDFMQGGFGNDTYFVDDADDKVSEFFDQGNQDIVNSAINYILGLGSNLENLNLLEGTAALNGTGNELDNIIKGNSANNIIDGVAGNDSLFGFAGSDTINGGDGDDWIVGGLGNDILTGGSGNDSFAFNSITDAGDRITDFTVGSDKIVLKEVVNSSGFRSSNFLADGFFSVRAVGSSMAAVMIDPDGAASLFRPAPFLLFNNVSAAALNNSSNFAF
jgi:trimeric autotransporter adhesin